MLLPTLAPAFLILLAEDTHATDYDETLLIPAVVLGVVALVYAAIAAWIVTPSSAAGH